MHYPCTDITDGSLATFHTMELKYKVSQHTLFVRNKSQDVSRRINTLNALQRYRNENTKVVYLNKTRFANRMGHSREWGDNTQPVTSSTYSRQLPPAEGERFVVIAGGTVDGLVESTYLCYSAISSQGDYHGETNNDRFKL